jgi:hypothetical protein
METLTAAKWLLATWQIQIAIGCGYAAYMIAYTGIRTHHQTIDVTFKTIAFGIVATGVILAMPGEGKLLVSITAFACTVGVAVLWRRIGMRLWMAILRHLDLTWADDTPSAWSRLSSEQRHHVTQLSVLTTDGVVHICDDAELCGAYPLGPCVLGTNGDVIMYVTHRKKTVDGESAEVIALDQKDWGVRSTYIPADKVARIEIRHRPIPVTTPIRNIWTRLFSRSRPEAEGDDSRSS